MRCSSWYPSVSVGEWDVPDGITLSVEVSEMFQMVTRLSVVVSEMFQMVSHCQRTLVRCSKRYPTVSGRE